MSKAWPWSKSDSAFRAFTWALSVALTTPTISAQQLTGSDGAGAILTGVAVDSLYGRALHGAIVQIDGSSVFGSSDSTGRFTVTGIPPGSHKVELVHPLLDTLGMRVITAPVELRGGDTTWLAIGIPSARTIVNRKCTKADRANGPAAVLGVVLDADTESPAAGAQVELYWTDYVIDKTSLKRLPQRRSATVQANGSYRICGLPDGFSTAAMASRNRDSTGIIALITNSLVTTASFHLPSGDPSTGAARGRAVLSGKVIDVNSKPVAHARVSVDDTAGTVTTSTDGTFMLRGLRAGTHNMIVRSLGHQPVEQSIELSSLTPLTVTARIGRSVTLLDTVRIVARRSAALTRLGFTARQRTGAGKFFSPEDIARMAPTRLNDLLSMAPGLRIRTLPDGRPVITGRMDGCVRYYVDGHRWNSGPDEDPRDAPDAFLLAPDIGAVEVYSSSSTPYEFIAFGPGGESCATVLIWTKWKLGG